MQTPTHEAYNELQTAFDHFNKTLYGGVLKLPMFTLQREKRTYGYCSRSVPRHRPCQHRAEKPRPASCRQCAGRCTRRADRCQ